MKTLSTEQQVELQALLDKVAAFQSFDNETNAQINFWSIELKPKRVRKKTDKELAGFSSEHII